MHQQEQVHDMPDVSQWEGSPLNVYAGSILSMTNLREEIRAAELSLRSVYEDDSGNLVQIGSPLLNERGIRSVIGKAISVVSRNTAFTSLKEREISAIMDKVKNDIIYDLALGKVKYQILDPVESTASTIVNIVCNPIYMTLKRSNLDGYSDKKFFKGTQQEITMHNQQSTKPGGLMGRFSGIFGG